MTLIAAWQENGIPFLIGDFLVSRIGEFKTPHHSIPTRDDLNNILPQDWYRQIVGLCQKVYRVSDTLIIGWCDSQLIAQFVIEDLFKIFGNKQPTLSQIREHLRNTKEYTDLACQLIGWLIEDEKPYCFHWDSKNPDSFELADKFIIGSGQNHFKKIFAPASTVGTLNHIDQALTRVGNLLGYEVLYGNNLWSLFGGGFQIAFLKNGSFAILSSVTYIFLFAKEDKDGVFFGSDKRILKYQYENQIMQVLELHTKRDTIADRKMHYVFPIDAKPNVNYTVYDNLSLVSEYYCIYVDIACHDNSQVQLVLTVTNDKKDFLLNILTREDKIEGLALRETLYSIVAEYLKSINRNKTNIK